MASRALEEAPRTHRNSPETKSPQLESAIESFFHGLVLLDLLSVAVLIHHAEVTQGRQVVLAVGLDKFLSLASLVSMSFGGTYAAKSLLQGTWRPLWLSWAPLGCVLGALGGVWEAYQGV